MNEIEKMYKNTGIIKKRECSYPNGVCKRADFIPCELCAIKADMIYPPFTAEKQIAILQLLTQQCDLTISHFTKWEFIHYDGQEPLEITGKDFTETFAKLINAYWQDLTLEEKEAIRGILRA